MWSKIADLMFLTFSIKLLNSERQVEGWTTQGLEGSETQNTVTSQDKSSTAWQA